ncbi:MAG: glycoside hydrolase family 16 protein [Porphyromonadaceae bacterium]|nr:MAG: glycoside hydrolase family 16 protein [Porphyromonadaceae bacterium]
MKKAIKYFKIIAFLLIWNDIPTICQTPFNDPNWNTTNLQFNISFINTLPDTVNTWLPNVSSAQSLIYSGPPCTHDKVYYTHQFQNMFTDSQGLHFVAKYLPTQIYRKRLDYWRPDTVLCDGYTNAMYFNYTSAALTSRQDFKYGYFEASIKVPQGQGLFPAFWMQQYNQEFDIMEMTPEQSASAIVYQANVYGTTIKSKDIVGPWGTPSINLSDTFHKYGIEWSMGRVTFFLDDSPVRMTSGPLGTFIADINIQIILDLCVNPWGQVTNPPPDKEMIVRYVKAYSFKAQSGNITSIPDYNSFNYKVYTTYVLGSSTVNASNVYLRAKDLIQFNNDFEVPQNRNFYAITTKLN